MVCEGVESGPREIIRSKGLVDVSSCEGVVRAIGELIGKFSGGDVVTLSKWNKSRSAER